MTRQSKVIFGLLAASTLVASAAFATMDIQKAFIAKYPEAKASLGKCSSCHEAKAPKKGEPGLNAYGKDMSAKATTDKKTWDFTKLEALDSDGDGKSNLDEIKAGTNPGAK